MSSKDYRPKKFLEYERYTAKGVSSKLWIRLQYYILPWNFNNRHDKSENCAHLQDL